MKPALPTTTPQSSTSLSLRSASTLVASGLLLVSAAVAGTGCAASETTQIAQTAETIKPAGAMMTPDAVFLGARDDLYE